MIVHVNVLHAQTNPYTIHCHNYLRRLQLKYVNLIKKKWSNPILNISDHLGKLDKTVNYQTKFKELVVKDYEAHLIII